MKPPTRYEMTMVAALIGARFGSGRSNPSSKRIMKSTQRFLLEVNAETTSSRGFCPKAVVGEDHADFRYFHVLNLINFKVFATFLGCVLFLIGPCC